MLLHLWQGTLGGSQGSILPLVHERKPYSTLQYILKKKILKLQAFWDAEHFTHKILLWAKGNTPYLHSQQFSVNSVNIFTV